MAMNPVIVVEQHFEPVVKLTCLNFKCKFNLFNQANDSMAHCNLKVIEIGEDGKCRNYEPLASEHKVEASKFS